MRLFNEGKTDRWAMSSAVDVFGATCKPHPHLLRLFMVLQLELALADGPVNSSEETTLLAICDQLEFSRYEFFGIKARLEAELRFGARPGPKRKAGSFYEGYRQQQRPHRESLGAQGALDEAYRALQLPSSATEAEVKKAYRRLISRHHPDKLAGTGLGTEALRRATEMTQQIQKAYDLICKTRGF